MQIIIDIDEKIYNEYMNLATGRIPTYKACDIAWVLKNGTILPKRHGRLIDADYLREDFKTSKKISFAERMDISCIVDHAPTIIEADKEE